MKFLTRLFVASLAMLAIADVASAQTPGSLTFDGVKLRKNGFTIEIQAPTGLGSDQTFTLPDLTGISNPSFLLSNSSAGQTITGGLTISGGLTLQNLNVLLKNTDNTAREFRFFEPSGSGNNYSAFKAQAQASDLTYTLPDAAPASGDVLKVTGVVGSDVTLSWGSGTPSGAAGGDLTGTYPNPTVAADAITSGKIADGTIVNADVSPAAAIAYSKLALTNSIVNTDYTANSITTSKIVDGTVTSAKIFDGTIVNADISAAAAVAYSKLNLTASVQGSDIASGTFTTTNAHHAIGNNDNTARELRFLEPSGSGVNYTAFKAQAQAGDLTYTLPSTAPTATSQVLQVQAVAGNNATLSWAAVGGGSILFARTGVIANAGNTSYNVVASDDIVGVDMSAGTNFTVNLTAATTAGEILIIKIEKYNNALLPVLTIQPNGTDKIDGANNLAFGNSGGVRRLYSDGAGNWYTW